MSNFIQVTNNLTENAVKTFTSFSDASGTNALRWKNYLGFTASWAVQVGETSEERSEILLLGTAAVAGTAGTFTANTVYDHSADTPIFAIKYNQVVFERSTVGTAGTATVIAGGTVNINPSEAFTQFDDTDGGNGYAYKTYYQNSVTGSTSAESGWTIVTPDFYSLQKIRSRIKNKLWNAAWLKDDVLDEWINECKDIMVNKAIQTNEDYALGTVNVGFGTDGLGTITTADFGQIRRFWVTYDGNNKYSSTKMNVNDYFSDQTFSSVHPFHAWRGDDVFVVRPSDSAGTAELTFYRWGTTMNNDSDVLPLPMRPFTHIFVNYAKSNALSKDQKENEAEVQMKRVENQVEDFVTSLAPRDKSGPTFVDLVEPISGEDYL